VLEAAHAWANYCYRDVAHGQGSVTATWAPTSASKTFTTNQGCAIDYNGSCPYAERDNKIEWTHADEATCLKRAHAWANYCYREAAHGHGAVSATWVPTGASETFTTNNGCYIDYNGSCPYAERDNKMEWTHADEATCMTRAHAWAHWCYREADHGNGAVTATWGATGATKTFTMAQTPTCSVHCDIVNDMVVVTHDTTSQHSHHRCYNAEHKQGWGQPVSSCLCSCCNAATSDCSDNSNYQI